MPLIILPSYPASGKKHRAKHLLNFHAQITAPADLKIVKLRTHYALDNTLYILRRIYDLQSKNANECNNNALDKDM